MVRHEGRDEERQNERCDMNVGRGAGARKTKQRAGSIQYKPNSHHHPMFRQGMWCLCYRIQSISSLIGLNSPVLPETGTCRGGSDGETRTIALPNVKWPTDRLTELGCWHS